MPVSVSTVGADDPCTPQALTPSIAVATISDTASRDRDRRAGSSCRMRAPAFGRDLACHMNSKGTRSPPRLPSSGYADTGFPHCGAWLLLSLERAVSSVGRAADS